ncbi:hypothetical protein ACLB2K_036693 [Fragaria x ananassa]
MAELNCFAQLNSFSYLIDYVLWFSLNLPVFEQLWFQQNIDYSKSLASQAVHVMPLIFGYAYSYIWC